MSAGVEALKQLKSRPRVVETFGSGTFVGNDWPTCISIEEVFEPETWNILSAHHFLKSIGLKLA